MAGSLHLVKRFNLSQEASSINFENCFSDDYDIYQCVLNDCSQTGTGAHFQLRFINNSGSVQTGNTYDTATHQLLSDNTSFGETRQSGESYIRGVFGQDVRSVAFPSQSVFYVFNPTNTSTYTYLMAQSTFYNSGNNSQGYKTIAVFKELDNVTGMHLFNNISGVSFDELDLAVYGVR